MPNPKDTVYLVALATWIKDAFWQIKGNCLRKEIENDFEFSKQSELDDASKYLQVVRSVVIAHPPIQLDIKIMVLDQKEESALI